MAIELNDEGCGKKTTKPTETTNTQTEDYECCGNCKYALFQQGRIFCTDRGFVMRALFGLDQMTPTAHCNRFVSAKTR